MEQIGTFSEQTRYNDDQRIQNPHSRSLQMTSSGAIRLSLQVNGCVRDVMCLVRELSWGSGVRLIRLEPDRSGSVNIGLEVSSKERYEQVLRESDIRSLFNGEGFKVAASAAELQAAKGL